MHPERLNWETNMLLIPFKNLFRAQGSKFENFGLYSKIKDFLVFEGSLIRKAIFKNNFLEELIRSNLNKDCLFFLLKNLLYLIKLLENETWATKIYWCHLNFISIKHNLCKVYILKLLVLSFQNLRSNQKQTYSLLLNEFLLLKTLFALRLSFQHSDARSNLQTQFLIWLKSF